MRILKRLTLVGRRVIVLPVLKELEELLCPPLLKETHERTLDRLHLRTGDFGDLAVAVDVTARNLLELEVARYIGVDKDAGELARRDDELGDEIDGIVAVTAELLGRRSAPELAVELYDADHTIRISIYAVQSKRV